MIGLIGHSYTHLDKTSFRCLFNSVARPHLEYCVSILYPLRENNEHLIENVLCRTTKLIPGLFDKTYNDRLAAIKVTSMR